VLYNLPLNHIVDTANHFGMLKFSAEIPFINSKVMIVLNIKTSIWGNSFILVSSTCDLPLGVGAGQVSEIALLRGVKTLGLGITFSVTCGLN
jgi:hypothetical protein